MYLFAHPVPLGSGGAVTISLAVVTWAAAILIYHRGWSGRDGARHELVCYASGLTLALAAVSPPLEHLSEDLVSLHMVQHVVLILIGALLIALSRPVETAIAGLPKGVRKTVGRLRRRTRLTPATTGRLARPLVVWMVYALSLWVWHGSVPYQAATEGTSLHVLEHGVFLAAASAFWSMVLVPRRFGPGPGFRLLALFTTAFHAVLLGALLTFSDTLWYPSYVEAAEALGIDPLADQRLAGLLMWVPGGLAYTGAGLWLVTDWLAAQSEGGSMRRGRALVESGPISPSRDRPYREQGRHRPGPSPGQLQIVGSAGSQPTPVGAQRYQRKADAEAGEDDVEPEAEAIWFRAARRFRSAIS